jgi:hypothetical protein
MRRCSTAATESGKNYILERAVDAVDLPEEVAEQGRAENAMLVVNKNLPTAAADGP